MQKTISRYHAAGFSLIELLVVLVILGLLAGLVVPNIMGKTEGAKVSTAKAAVNQIAMNIDNFYLDNGRAPDNLRDLVSAPGDAERWNGPYIKESLLKDPWGREYAYRFPGEHGDYDVMSYGADGTAGGEGNNADIGNWQ